MDYRELLDIAVKNKKNAYSPYSNIQVSSAVLTKCGKVFLGVNVENASFGATCCAERNAIGNAISHGYRDFKAIAICSNLKVPTFPCGICRQVIIEFSEDIDIIIGDENNYTIYSIKDLMINSFNKKDII